MKKTIAMIPVALIVTFAAAMYARKIITTPLKPVPVPVLKNTDLEREITGYVTKSLNRRVAHTLFHLVEETETPETRKDLRRRLIKSEMDYQNGKNTDGFSEIAQEIDSSITLHNKPVPDSRLLAKELGGAWEQLYAYSQIIRRDGGIPPAYQKIFERNTRLFKKTVNSILRTHEKILELN